MKRILLVEDEESLQECIAEMLRRSGYKVETVAGSSALAILQECGDLDLLITDVTMPGNNGIDVAHHILKKQPGLPIIFISGHLKEDILSRYPDAPMGFFMQKPFSLVGLERMVAGLTGSQPVKKADAFSILPNVSDVE